MKIRCKGCRTVFDIDEADACPGCGAKVPRGGVKPPSDEEPVAKPAGEALPTLMRANKKVAGKTCPGCDNAIALGVEVHNCEECQASHHAACWDSRGGCAGACAASAKRRPRKAEAIGTPVSGGDGGDDIPCKFCGEAIKRQAKKCRHCGEFQSELDRRRNAARSSASSDDDDMTTGDWIVAILCAGIGCIAGIVWSIQGKKKGPKMIGVSLLAMVIWNVLNAALMAGGRR